MDRTDPWLPGLAAPPLLEGARVALRAPAVEDAPGVLAFLGDPRAMRYWSTPPLPDLAAATARIEDWRRGFEAREFLCFAIAPRDGNALVGTVTLFNIDPGQRRAEIGYGLAPAWWGRGLASEALGLALGFAFGALGLARIEADTDPRNHASCRLLERLGFRREGLLRERWRVGGEVQDSAIFGLLAREFEVASGAGPSAPALA